MFYLACVLQKDGTQKPNYNSVDIAEVEIPVRDSVKDGVSLSRDSCRGRGGGGGGGVHYIYNSVDIAEVEIPVIDSVKDGVSLSQDSCREGGGGGGGYIISITALILRR